MVFQLPPKLNNDQGVIFNIQRFSVHDGPGIRTTVFLKGCPLRCLWCSNPESQAFSRNIMVRDINCTGCGACVKRCPNGAIAISDSDGRQIDWAKCDDCLLCVEACKYQSLRISGEIVHAKDAFDEIIRDLSFYKNSGGGVTVSGGEPLSQPQFLKSLLKLCKDRGIHTALDTSGFAPWEVLAEVLPLVDLVLFDLKQLNSKEHRQATGVENTLIISNLSKTAQLCNVWLRVPVIPGFNDSGEHIRQIAQLAKISNVEKISLLPYHEGGKSKCQQLGRKFGMEEKSPPEDSHLADLANLINDHDLMVTIGS